MILPPDSVESQVVSMRLKLAAPRTSGGPSKTLCIKVRKMKRRRFYTERIELLMILCGDTINVSEIFTAQKKKESTELKRGKKLFA